MKKATAEGYKCVIVNFRGAAGVKMTSARIYSSAYWEDFKEPIDYIHKNYCSGNDEFEKRRIYGYAVSLGAAMVNLYLVNEGSNSKLSGAIIFC